MAGQTDAVLLGDVAARIVAGIKPVDGGGGAGRNQPLMNLTRLRYQTLALPAAGAAEASVSLVAKAGSLQQEAVSGFGSDPCLSSPRGRKAQAGFASGRVRKPVCRMA